MLALAYAKLSPVAEASGEGLSEAKRASFHPLHRPSLMTMVLTGSETLREF